MVVRNNPKYGSVHLRKLEAAHHGIVRLVVVAGGEYCEKPQFLVIAKSV